MGDAPSASGSTNEPPAAVPGVGHTDSQVQPGYSQPDPQPAFAYQIDRHQQHGGQHQHQHAFASQYDMTAQPPTPGHGPPDPYNMSSMMHSLPPPNFRLKQQQRFNAPNPGGVSHTMPHISPYVTSAAMNSMPGPQYYMSQHPAMPQYYGPAMPASQQQHQHQQQDGMAARANMVAYYQQQPQHGQAQYYYPPGIQFANHAPVPQSPMAAGQYVPAGLHHEDPRLMQQQTGGQGGGVTKSTRADGVKPDSRSSVVRGPPRKPRQSGHAIWIGNLPPQTDLMRLVYHVCKEAPGLESLFLISKSNCAFANFKDEAACVAAQQKIHDSKFQSVRLVSRLRKSTVEGASGVTAPTGPSASTPQSTASQETAGDGSSATPPVAVPDEASSQEDEAAPAPVASPVPSASPAPLSSVPTPQKDKYFILKSLTVEDLEQSVQTGIWATQSHNEKALNHAFQIAENVYLIFSANKSGEYFGYARMTSQINEDPAAAIEFAPKAQSAADVSLPKAIPTEPNEFMPRGRIMDDSERGTIFWEAEPDEDAGDGESAAGGDATADDSGSAGSTGGETGESKAWGKPFHLEWINTSRLPFYRTRGLRNPWNSNKEVKIARDGTELEPSVGRKLTALFSPRPQGVPVTNAAASGMRQHQVPMMVPRYPPGRPHFQQ